MPAWPLLLFTHPPTHKWRPDQHNAKCRAAIGPRPGALPLPLALQVVIEAIHGDGGRLTLDPAKNCIGVAATEALRLIGQVSCGVSLTLHKVCGCVCGWLHGYIYVYMYA